MDVLAGIDRSIGLVKRLREISKKVSEAEFRNVLGDLSNELADAKLKIATLKEQLATQVEEIRELKRAASQAKQKPSVKWGCYKFEGDENLYCTACYDSKGVKSLTNRLNTKLRQCPVCKAQIGAG
jgi:hypothetical protein